MKLLMKIIGIAGFALVTLAALVIVYVSLNYDANSLRPEIEKFALTEGYIIDIEGDLKWQFLPNPGISVRQLSWREIEHTSGTVGELILTIDWGGALSILGGGQPAVDGADAAAQRANNLQLAALVDGIRLRDTSVVWQRPQMPEWTFDHIALRLSNVSTDGRRFPIEIELRTLDDVEVRVVASLALDLAAQTVSIVDLDASAGGARLRGDLAFNGAPATAIGAIELQDLNLKQWLGSLQQPFPEIEVPRTVSARALTQLGAQLEYHLEANGRSTLEVKLDIDGQSLDVDANSDASSEKLQIVLSAPRFAVGDYLAPDDDNPRAGPQQSTHAALFAPLAPLMLWPGQAQMEINLATLQLNGYELSNLYTKLFSNRGVLRVASLNADLFGGQLNALGVIDASGATPRLTLQPSLTDIHLTRALPALADSEDLSGLFSLQANLVGRGASGQSLLRSLTGNGNFNLLRPRYSSINVEQMFCSGTQLLSGGGLSNQQWPEGTDLHDVAGAFNLRDGNLLLDSLTTGTGNLKITANGTVGLLARTYRIEAATRLDGTTTSANGCSVNANLRDRDIPFVCSGSFDQKGAPKCLPDSGGLGASLKNTALQKLGEKLLGKDGKNPPDVTDLLKGLFN